MFLPNENGLKKFVDIDIYMYVDFMTLILKNETALIINNIQLIHINFSRQ